MVVMMVVMMMMMMVVVTPVVMVMMHVRRRRRLGRVGDGLHLRGGEAGRKRQRGEAGDGDGDQFHQGVSLCGRLSVGPPFDPLKLS